jgi:hypothetical protein
MTRSTRALYLLLLIALISAMFAWSQSSTTSIRGTVSDEKGAVIPNAKVTLSNLDTGYSRTIATDGIGAYQFVQLQPGTYTLQVSSSGFATIKQSVQLLVDSPATLNMMLQIGKMETTVEVSGEAPLINTQDATIGNAFNLQQITSLPFEARDPVGMLSLQPGVAFIGEYSPNPDEDSRNGAVSGARSDQTNVTLDGVQNNSSGGYAFRGALRSTMDSLQEFRVTTTAGGADAGRSSGAQVSLVTKSGTNNWHGSAYEYYRPTFVANDWFIKQSQLQSDLSNRPPKLVRNTFGASVGGPIIKDRAFFFANYEGMRRRESESWTRIVPSEDLRNGYLSYFSCGADTSCPVGSETTLVRLTPQQITAMDPLHIGPSSQILALLNQYPLPNNDSVGDGLNFRGYSFTSAVPTNWNTYIAKLDFNVTRNGSHRVFFRGNLQGDRQSAAAQWVYPDGTSTPPRSAGHWNNKGFAVGYTAALSNTVVNNFRYSFIRPGYSSSGAGQGHYVTLRGLDNLEAQTRTQSLTVPQHSFANDTTWTRGKHTFQFGGNMQLVSSQSSNDLNSWFSATTNPSWLAYGGIANTGQGLDPAAAQLPPVANFFSNSFNWPMGNLVGIVAQVNAQYNRDKTGAALPEGTFLSRNYKRYELEWYGQDSWHVKPNLTLTLGLRYALLQPPYEANGVQVQPTIDMHQWYVDRYTNALQGISFKEPIAFDLSGQANGKKPYWNWDKMDFAPRFSFAYSPGFENSWLKKLFGGAGKGSIRGGYGMYHDHFGQGVVDALNQYSSFGLSASLTNPASSVDTATAPRFTGLHNIPTVDQLGNAVLLPAPAGSFPAVFPDAFAITSGLDDHLKTPYAHVFDLSITRELSRNTSLEVAYIGRIGKRLLQQDDMAMPLNLVDPSSKMSYYQAAQMLSRMVAQGVDINSVAPIPYWQNLFPGAAGLGVNVLAGCAQGVTLDPVTGYPTNPGSFSATQAVYDLFACFPHNETGALQYLDLACFPSCSINGQYSYFDPQFSSLYSWRSIGVSSYHAMVVTLRRKMTNGVQFDFNYTFSKSIDMGSDAERVIAYDEWGGLGQINDSWNPRGNKGLSDFDARHQMNANWTVELPFGRGKKWASGFNGAPEALLGGWSLSGIFRWANSYPFSVSNGANWATNWQLGGNAVFVGPKPKTGSFITADGANMFKDPEAAMASWRYALPGEAGSRNVLGGPGYFSMDGAVSKNWKITEGTKLRFVWQVFNVLNSVSFDGGYSVASSLDSSSSFGKYNQTLTKPRTMELGLRLDF